MPTKLHGVDCRVRGAGYHACDCGLDVAIREEGRQAGVKQAAEIDLDKIKPWDQDKADQLAVWALTGSDTTDIRTLGPILLPLTRRIQDAIRFYIQHAKEDRE